MAIHDELGYQPFGLRDSEWSDQVFGAVRQHANLEQVDTARDAWRAAFPEYPQPATHFILGWLQSPLDDVVQLLQRLGESKDTRPFDNEAHAGKVVTTMLRKKRETTLS